MVDDYSEMEITGEEFLKIINNPDKPVVVNFFAEWHMPCLMLLPVIEDLASQMEEVKFVKINIEDKKPNTIKPEFIPLDIVYEDQDLAVINKPSGLVVHPAPGNYEHTLVNALLYHFKNLSDINPERPGIIHRLDKQTSGLLIIVKNKKPFSGYFNIGAY